MLLIMLSGTRVPGAMTYWPEVDGAAGGSCARATPVARARVISKIPYRIVQLSRIFHWWDVANFGPVSFGLGFVGVLGRSCALLCAFRAPVVPCGVLGREWTRTKGGIGSDILGHALDEFRPY